MNPRPPHGGPAPRPALLHVLLALAASCSFARTLAATPPLASRPLPPPGNLTPGFTLLPPATTHIHFTNHLDPDLSLRRSPLNNGSGIALGDVDGDGLCDIFLCGLDSPNALYRNQGRWRFDDVTRKAGLAGPGRWSTSAVLADIDGDGDLDLLVGSVGQGVQLWTNDGHGAFAPAPNAGLASHGAAMSLALADFDGDGDLDLYVAHYRATTIQDEPGTRFSLVRDQGRLVLKSVNGMPADDPRWKDRFALGPDGEVLENGEPDTLYRNLGSGRFEPVPWTGGAFLDESGQPLREPPRDWGLGVLFRDANGDGLPDLFVCNDADSPDRFWLNLGGGRFRAVDRRAWRTTSLSSMGADMADIDRDGHDDVVVLDMLARSHRRRMVQLELPRPLPVSRGEALERQHLPRNTVLWNRGDGSYAEVGWLSGLAASDWSWTAAFLDVDLDGWEDLLVSNGFHRDVRDQDALRAESDARSKGGAQWFEARRAFPPWPTPNAAFRNLGGLRFEDRSKAWRFDLPAISQGMALADLDGDGDLDVVINNMEAAPFLLRNDAPGGRVHVRLRGRPPNTSAIGARITWAPMEDGPLPPQSQVIMAGGRYLSSDAPARAFAAPRGQAFRLLVRWPSGQTSQWSQVPPDVDLVAEEGP